MDGFSLQGLTQWIQEQAQYALFIVLIFVMIIFAAKRAWIGLIGAVFALAVVGVFIVDPDVLKKLSEWVGEKLNMNA